MVPCAALSVLLLPDFSVGTSFTPFVSMLRMLRPARAFSWSCMVTHAHVHGGSSGCVVSFLSPLSVVFICWVSCMELHPLDQ